MSDVRKCVWCGSPMNDASQTRLKLAMHNCDEVSKRDCRKALMALAGWYVTPEEGYGFNTSWAIADLCRAIEQLRKEVAAK
jgi:hypothetical protein